MNETDLYRAVARATGESVDTIRRLGFSLVDVEQPVEPSSELGWDVPVIDWDDLEENRAHGGSGDLPCVNLPLSDRHRALGSVQTARCSPGRPTVSASWTTGGKRGRARPGAAGAVSVPENAVAVRDETVAIVNAAGASGASGPDKSPDQHQTM